MRTRAISYALREGLPAVLVGDERRVKQVITGLLSNAVSYPQHQSLAVTSASLTGISLITTAAAWQAVRPFQLYLNLPGCALMLGSSYLGRRIAAGSGRGCSGCSDCP